MSWGHSLKNPFWLPLNKEGLLDYKAVFQIVHGECKQPYGALDDMTVSEVSWLIESNETNKKDYYEMVSYSIKNAMMSVNKGKDMKMFEEEKVEEQKLSKEDREKELAYLKNKFKEL